MADHRAQVEDLLAGYRRSREQLGAVQRSLAGVRESVTSEDGRVTVTVSGSGTLVDLTIEDDAYRALRPAELAELIVGTTAAATALAARQANEVLAPVLPADTDPAALLNGTADLSAEELTPAPEPEPDGPDETFEDKSWMQSGGTRHARRV